jgi:hypothetical protein
MQRYPMLFILAVLVPLAWTSSAHAFSLYAGILGGYGATTEDSSVEPYSLGFGGRAGLTLSDDLPLYLGARLLWFAGDTGNFEVTGSGASASAEISQSYLTYGVDIGYDLELGPIVLRPELGIGGATLYLNQASTAGLSMVETSEGSLYLAPAVELLIELGLLYVGAEVRYLALTGSGQLSGVALLAHLGLTI